MKKSLKSIALFLTMIMVFGTIAVSFTTLSAAAIVYWPTETEFKTITIGETFNVKYSWGTTYRKNDLSITPTVQGNNDIIFCSPKVDPFKNLYVCDIKGLREGKAYFKYEFFAFDTIDLKYHSFTHEIYITVVNVN